MKADIVCIQETHNVITEDKWIGNFRYISNAAKSINNNKNEKGIGGIAIMIKEDWYQNIEKITRHSNRSIQIALNTGDKNKKLQILNTYAPHMGYGKEDRDEYWKETKGILKQIKKDDILVWTTDNNGQIARKDQNNDHPEEKTLKTTGIGRWHLATKSEKREWRKT